MPLVTNLSHYPITKHSKTIGRTEEEPESSREFELQKVTTA